MTHRYLGDRQTAERWRGQPCRVLIRAKGPGPRNALVEFADGSQVVVLGSGRVLRRLDHELPLTVPMTVPMKTQLRQEGTDPIRHGRGMRGRKVPRGTSRNRGGPIRRGRDMKRKNVRVPRGASRNP